MCQYRIIDFHSHGEEKVAAIVCRAALDLHFYGMDLRTDSSHGFIESENPIPFDVLSYFDRNGVSLQQIEPRQKMEQGSLFE